MRPYLIFVLRLFLTLAIIDVTGQHQLLLVSGNEVVHRFKVGETFRSKWKDSHEEHWGFIVALTEFEIITSQDTINISQVRKVLLPGRPLVNKIGKTLLTVGLLYVTIDQFNWTIVHGHEPKMEDSVWKPAALLVGAGIPMILFKKNWKKIKRGVHLLSVDQKSKLYIPQ